MIGNPSRTVRRSRCVVCNASFLATRRDAKYCSGKCRQRALEARAGAADIDREIEEARRNYWSLIRRQAESSGQSVSQVLTAKSQFVDEDGNVYMGGNGGMGGMGEGRRLVGKTTPRPGWSTWGLEAAGAPFNPPPRPGRHGEALSMLPKNKASELVRKWRKPGGAP